MGRKKPFIKKGEGVKFFLVHRSQKDPLYLADNLGEHVLVPANPEQADESIVEAVNNAASNGKLGSKLKEPKEKRIEEQQQYGIYYEDNYDYLQHLKEVNINDDEESKEDQAVKVGSVLIKTDAFNEEKQPKSKLLLPSTVFASKFEEDVGYFNQAAPDHDPKINWDPDIVRLLDEDADIDTNDNGELEDDFFMRANLDSKNDEFGGEEEDDDDDGDNFSSNAATEDEDDDDEGNESETKSMREMDSKSRFSQYSMTSSVIRRNEGLRLLDDQFEKLYAQYDDDQIGGLDTEEIDGFRAQDSVLNAALEEFGKLMEKKSLVTEKIPKSKKLPVLHEKNESENESEEEYESESDSSSHNGSESELLRFAKKREKDDRLDCESIISTYSTIYNHPKMISDSNAQIKLSKKTGLPLGVLSEKDKTKRELEKIEHNIVRVLPDLPLKRDPNETKEEKKERKQAVKLHRKERRVEKKINKVAFKEEKKAQIGQVTNAIINKNIVKLPL